MSVKRALSVFQFYFVLRSLKLVRSTCGKSNQYKNILYQIYHIFLRFCGGAVLTSIIINPIVLDDSPSHIVLNLANCEGIEALMTISGSFTLLPQPPPPHTPFSALLRAALIDYLMRNMSTLLSLSCKAINFCNLSLAIKEGQYILHIV